MSADAEVAPKPPRQKAPRKRPRTPAPASPCLAFAGNLTIYEARTAKDTLLEGLAQTGAAALDLSQVAEIDSAGLQLLLLAKREVEADGRALSIPACSAAVREFIGFFRLADALGLAPAAD